MVWEPKTCCCGASLKTGTLILGWLGIIGNAFSLITLFRFVAFSRNDWVKICSNVSQMMDSQTMDCQMCADHIIGFIVVYALIILLGIAICASLLYGVTKYKPVMMLPFLVSQAISMAIFGILIVVGVIISFWAHAVLGGFILLILGGLFYFLKVYLFLVVRSCYLEVKQHSQAMMNGGNIAYVEQRDIPYKI